jgi:hypothetical protein
VISKLVKKLVKEAHSLAWTIAGTALVLITLSGDVKQKGLMISAIALVIHLTGILLSKED